MKPKSSEAGQIELLRVRSLILEAGYEFPELRGRNGETTEDAVYRLLEQHRMVNLALRNSHHRLAEMIPDSTPSSATDEDLKTLEHQLRCANIELHQNVNQLVFAEDELKRARIELTNYGVTMKEKDKSLTEVQASMNTMARKHEADLKKYKNRIKDLQKHLEADTDRAAKWKHEHGDHAANLAELAIQKERADELERVAKSLQAKNVELIYEHVASRKKETEALRKEQNILREEFERELSALRASKKEETDALRKEQQTLKDDHARQIKEMRSAVLKKAKTEDHLHSKAVESLQNQLKDERAKSTEQMAALTKELKTALTDCEQNMKAQFAEQERAHHESLDKQRRSFAQEIGRYENLLRQERAHLKEAQKGQEERQAGERRRLEEELRKQEQSLKIRYEQEQYQLQTAVEDLKGALVVKQHFKGLADSEVASQFNKLAREIEDFARIEWSAEREARWSEQLQQLYPRNTRKLKQALVQNSVWIGLRALIFRSPFELFGEEEGWKDLNQQWIDIYAMSKYIVYVWRRCLTLARNTARGVAQDFERCRKVTV